jgi:hypothetical protein
MAEKTRIVPLSAEQEKWYAAACERLNPERLQKLLLNLIDIHSPTGAERQASEFIAGYMREHLGEHSRYQAISEDTGNAIGELRGSGGGASLLLYGSDRHSYRRRSGKGPTVRLTMSCLILQAIGADTVPNRQPIERPTLARLLLRPNALYDTAQPGPPLARLNL